MRSGVNRIAVTCAFSGAGASLLAFEVAAPDAAQRIEPRCL
jgi:hypothetical protein